MEDLEGTDTLRAAVDRLGELTHHEDAHIRGDACHYLALADTPKANDYIRSLLDAPDSGVREVARESLG